MNQGFRTTDWTRAPHGKPAKPEVHTKGSVFGKAIRQEEVQKLADAIPRKPSNGVPQFRKERKASPELPLTLVQMQARLRSGTQLMATNQGKDLYIPGTAHLAIDGQEAITDQGGAYRARANDVRQPKHKCPLHPKTLYYACPKACTWKEPIDQPS